MKEGNLSLKYMKGDNLSLKYIKGDNLREIMFAGQGVSFVVK